MKHARTRFLPAAFVGGIVCAGCGSNDGPAATDAGATDATAGDGSTADAGCLPQSWTYSPGGTIDWAGGGGAGFIELTATDPGTPQCATASRFCSPSPSLGGQVASVSGDFDVTFTFGGFQAGQEGDTVALVLSSEGDTSGQTDWARATYTYTLDGALGGLLQTTISHDGSITQGAPQSLQAGNLQGKFSFHAVRQAGALTISATLGPLTATQQGTFSTALQPPVALVGVYSTQPAPDGGSIALSSTTLTSISVTATGAELHSDTFTCDDLGQVEMPR